MLKALNDRFERPQKVQKSRRSTRVEHGRSASPTNPRATRRHDIQTSGPDRMSTYRNDDRSSAGSSFARTFANTLIALGSLQPACAKWLGDGGVTGSNVNGESREGNTRMVQFTDGTPTVMQLAYDTGVTTAPESFIVMSDHSMILVPKDPNRSASMWDRPEGRYSGTGWGTFANAIATSTGYGDQEAGLAYGTGADALRSGLSYGHVSYHIKDAAGANASLGYNQFFVVSGPTYVLNGCPNYSPGNTSENMNWECPRVPVSPGEYKFSILGLLQGTQINSAHESSFGDFSASTSPHYRDIAKYRSLVMSIQLDISGVGADVSSRAAWVSFANGTKVNFTDITPDMDLGGCKMHFMSPNVTNGEKEIIVSFAQSYSTGSFTRSYQDAVDEFGCYFCECTDCTRLCPDGKRENCDGSAAAGGCKCEPPTDGCSIGCSMNGYLGYEGQARDLTGWGVEPDSWPIAEPGSNGVFEKMGRGGLNASDSRLVGLNIPRATQTPASTVQELQGLAGAPALNVTEVRAVKITMRKHTGCAGRPAKPAGDDASGALGITWPDAPADCPSWYLGAQGGDWNDVTMTHSAPEDRVPPEDATFCAGGEMDCYLIDIHLALELDDGTRTVLGSPENDPVRGMSKGTFFMYDPEITDDPNKPYPTSYDDSLKPGASSVRTPTRGADKFAGDDASSGDSLVDRDPNLIFVFIGVFIGVVALVICIVVYCLAVRKRKRLKVSGTKQVKAEI